MHERPEDLAELQNIIDRSYRAAGPHLLDISTPERRLDATEPVSYTHLPDWFVGGQFGS